MRVRKTGWGGGRGPARDGAVADPEGAAVPRATQAADSPGMVTADAVVKAFTGQLTAAVGLLRRGLRG